MAEPRRLIATQREPVWSRPDRSGAALIRRVAEAAARKGVALDIRILPASADTSEEAATAVALVTESGNARAHAAYIRAGMRVSGKPFHDTDTRGGQPVESILMIRDRPGGTAGGR